MHQRTPARDRTQTRRIIAPRPATPHKGWRTRRSRLSLRAQSPRVSSYSGTVFAVTGPDASLLACIPSPDA